MFRAERLPPLPGTPARLDEDDETGEDAAGAASPAALRDDDERPASRQSTGHSALVAGPPGRGEPSPGEARRRDVDVPSSPSSDHRLPSGPTAAHAGTGAPGELRESNGERVHMMSSERFLPQPGRPLGRWAADSADEQPGGREQRETTRRVGFGSVAFDSVEGETPHDDEDASESRELTVELVRKVWLAEDVDLHIDCGSIEQQDDAAMCPICLEQMFAGRAIVTSCSHCFHIGCCRESERMAVSTKGFWSCPSCREIITTIRTRPGEEPALELSSAPAGTSPNLTYFLERNRRLQSVVWSLLLLEDFVVGSCRSNEQVLHSSSERSANGSDEAEGFRATDMPRAAEASLTGEQCAAYLAPRLKDEVLEVCGESAHAEEKYAGGDLVHGDGNEAGRQGAACSGGDICDAGTAHSVGEDGETGRGFVVEDGYGEEGAWRRRRRALEAKGPGVLSATVAMRHVLQGHDAGPRGFAVDNAAVRVRGFVHTTSTRAYKRSRASRASAIPSRIRDVLSSNEFLYGIFD